MGKIETEIWNIVDDLTTETDIQYFVEASIEEAKDDADPSLLAHALATAAEARRRLAGKDPAPCAEPGDDPGVCEFDRTARLFGYHVTLSPVT